MKFTIQVIVIAVLAYVLQSFFPWWTLVIAAFLGGWIFNTRANFFAGFVAIALLWTIQAQMIESNAAAPLTDRVATIFSVSKPILFVLTAAIGGLVGGFAAMTGSALNKKRNRGYY